MALGFSFFSFESFELWTSVFNDFNLRHFASNFSYYYLCESESVFGIRNRIRIPNTDPQSWWIRIQFRSGNRQNDNSHYWKHQCCGCGSTKLLNDPIRIRIWIHNTGVINLDYRKNLCGGSGTHISSVADPDKSTRVLTYLR